MRVRCRGRPRAGCVGARQQEGGAAGDEAAALEHVAAVGHGERLAHVLLDHQHGDALVGDAPHDGEQLVDHARREAERGLVEHQEARRAHHARAPPPPSAARRRSSCRRAGARARRAWESRAAPGPAAARARPCGTSQPPSSRFSVTVICGKSWRPSGTSARPRRTMSEAFAPASSSTPSSSTAAAARQQPGERLQQRGLAGAVRAEDHGDARAARPASARAAPRSRRSRRRGRRSRGREREVVLHAAAISSPR